ncbi:MAG: SufE family protein [Rhabdochlamydiaceae bacterium]|jgi:cysteine desulfuration protein SufE
MTFETCLEKQSAVKELFSHCLTVEEKYIKIIGLGQALPPLDPIYHLPENLVEGCQSMMYLFTTCENGKMAFKIYSEALISKGLAALLILIYEGETPEALLKCPPTVLSQIGIQETLTPGRSNGLFNLYLKMKQQALMSFKTIK